ncbi:MAG: hypothetical protein AABY28_00425 [Candidatus Omnitrophota bacterium]
MRGKTILALLAFIFYLFLSGHYVFAEDAATGYNTTGTQEGRYVLVTVNKVRGYTGTQTLQKKTPAIVLDSYLGIVWRCQDTKNEKPLWIKTDLGKNSDKQLSKRKYIISIPPYSGEDYKIPAIVLDMEEGKSWICSDIASESAKWVLTDLPKDIKQEGYAY